MIKKLAEIEKLNLEEKDLKAVEEKINEIIDSVNFMKSRYDQLEKWIEKQRNFVHDFADWMYQRGKTSRIIEYKAVLQKLAEYFPSEFSKKELENFLKLT